MKKRWAWCLLLSHLYAGPVWACSCLFADIATTLQQTPIIVEAQALQTRSEDDVLWTQFEVLHAFKGPATASRIEVLSQNLHHNSCGFSWKPQQTTLLFLQKGPHGYEVLPCPQRLMDRAIGQSPSSIFEHLHR